MKGIAMIGRVLAAVAALGLITGGCNVAEAKTLRLNITADPSQMDPITQSELIAGDILRNMYEGLTAIDRDGKIIPALATQWEAVDGGKTWRFHLRPNVKLQTGRVFIAGDVKRSYEALLTPELKPGVSQVYLADIVGAKDMLDGKTRTLSGVTVVD